MEGKNITIACFQLNNHAIDGALDVIALRDRTPTTIAADTLTISTTTSSMAKPVGVDDLQRRHDIYRTTTVSPQPVTLVYYNIQCT
jgi:hypothetical protein